MTTIVCICIVVIFMPGALAVVLFRITVVIICAAVFRVHRATSVMLLLFLLLLNNATDITSIAGMG